MRRDKVTGRWNCQRKKREIGREHQAAKSRKGNRKEERETEKVGEKTGRKESRQTKGEKGRGG